MLNKQNRRLGDYVAGTVVVHEKLTDEVRPGWNATESTASVSPQIANVTAEELVLIETYLHRRWDLDPVVRFSTSNQIAERIKAKTGLQRQQGESIDDFLESVARQIRDGARFG
jgi:regulator of sigma D